MHATPIQIRDADLNHAPDGAAVLAVLNSYAADPVGGGEPLPADVRARLIPALRNHPTTLVLLAFEGTEPVGLAVGFFGLSSFRALPLLNIHDLAIVPLRRGRGIGQLLLQAAEDRAKARNCCKITLEVQDDNTRARRLYERVGFRDVTYGGSGPTRFLAKPLG
jgi:ribosomal protein S18 acetylase RimI-like enzyme